MKYRDTLFSESCTYDILSGNQKRINNYKSFEHCACFQSPSSLFIAQGDNHYGERSNRFFSITQEGIKTKLSPLIKKREFLTLAGFSNTLLAVGGYDLEYIKYVELYRVKTNSW